MKLSLNDLGRTIMLTVVFYLSFILIQFLIDRAIIDQFLIIGDKKPHEVYNRFTWYLYLKDFIATVVSIIFSIYILKFKDRLWMFYRLIGLLVLIVSIILWTFSYKYSVEFINMIPFVAAFILVWCYYINERVVKATKDLDVKYISEK